MSDDLTDHLDRLKELAIFDAVDKAPAESCGLIINDGGEFRYLSCRNVSTVGDQFAIDPRDYCLAEDQGDVVCIVHSHPATKPEPSPADRVGIERSQLPWLIVNPITKEHTLTGPCGYILPLFGREFIHGVVDCLTIVQDVYEMIGITLKNYEREGDWWLAGKNHYMDRYEDCGFFIVDDLQDYDMVLMQIGAPVPNHAAVYLDGHLIHHCANRLSCKDIYDGAWRKSTTHYMRHHETDSLTRTLGQAVRDEILS